MTGKRRRKELVTPPATRTEVPKLRLSLILCLTFLATQSLRADSEPKLLFQYGFGPVFTSPSAANSQIDRANTAVQNAGLKNFSLPRIGTIWGSSVFAGFRFSEFWDAGISFSSYKLEISASDTLKGVKYTDTVNGGFQSWRVKTLYHFVRATPWSMYFAPAAGIAVHSLDETVTVTGDDTASASMSNTAFTAAAGVGADYKANKYFSLSIQGGYSYARSGALKVDSQSGTGYAVGQNLKWNGTDAILDFSGPYITAALTLYLSLPSSPREPKDDDQAIRSAEPAQRIATPETPETVPVKEEPPPSKNSDDSIEEKLNRIKQLRDRGIITEGEYESMRREILEKIL